MPIGVYLHKPCRTTERLCSCGNKFLGRTSAKKCPVCSALPRGACIKCGSTERNRGGDCSQCNRVRGLARYARVGPSEYVERERLRRLKNPGCRVADAEKYRSANRDKCNAASLKSCKENPARCNAQSAKRKAAKLQAIPAWAIDFIIEEAYALAALRTTMTGFKWHVDHVVPLQSKLVCGLHVHNNLQVIPASVNQAKNNRYWPDMPT